MPKGESRPPFLQFFLEVFELGSGLLLMQWETNWLTLLLAQGIGKLCCSQDFY